MSLLYRSTMLRAWGHEFGTTWIIHQRLRQFRHNHCQQICVREHDLILATPWWINGRRRPIIHHEDLISQGSKTQLLSTCSWTMLIRAGNDDGILCPVPCSRGQVWGNKLFIVCYAKCNPYRHIVWTGNVGRHDYCISQCSRSYDRLLWCTTPCQSSTDNIIDYLLCINKR